MWTWNDESKTKLRQLRADGLSSAQIAVELRCPETGIGPTRNAVIGASHRAGLPIPAKHVGRTRGPGKKLGGRRIRLWRNRLWQHMASIGVHRTDQPREKPAPTVIASRGLSLIDLERQHCRWPTSGEGITTLFCGATAVERLPYCAGHCRMAFSVPRRVRVAA